MKPWIHVVVGVFGLLLASVSAVGAIPDLSGTWAMVQVYPQKAVLPFVGEVARTSYVVQWVDVSQDGALLTMTDRYCLTFVDDGTSLATTEIPDRFMASLEPGPRTAALHEDGAEILFVQDPYVEVRGVVLENPEEDPLPIEPDDPRVFDQDGDGHPGMTVRAKILGIIDGETYVVQRVRYVLRGRMVTPERIEGALEWSDEQTILEATNPLLEVETTAYPDPDPSRHVFVMVRVEESSTCEWLGERWRGILGLEQEEEAP